MPLNERKDLLKQLTSRELKELAKLHQIELPKGAKKSMLVTTLAKNLDLPIEELKSIRSEYVEDKLMSKIKNAEDYFLTDQVKVTHFEEGFAKGVVGNHEVKIFNLGTPEFSYNCDDKCNDYLYQVKKGRSTFCKHYPALIAELIFEGHISPSEQEINLIEGRVRDTLLESVRRKEKDKGIIQPSGRDLGSRFKRLQKDLIPLSLQDTKLARKEYHEPPETAFEQLVGEAFALMEFEVIRRRSPHGWDLLVLGEDAVPPYVVVVECKTSASGKYNYLRQDENYLIRLKEYCDDMLRQKLRGPYKKCVKYMVLVAPGFPEQVEGFCQRFEQSSGGIKLSFWPAESLQYLVVQFFKEKILTDDFCKPLFEHQGILTKEDIDQTFAMARGRISELVSTARSQLRESFYRQSETSSDASFVNLNEISLQTIIDEVLNTLEPTLVLHGKEPSMGVKLVKIKHDYFQIWREVLLGLAEELTSIFGEISEAQEKSTEFKNQILTFLGLK
jgi:hypothetical protein